MAKSNEQIARAFLEAISNRGLTAALRDFTTPDLVWWVAGFGEMQGQLAGLDGAFGRHFVEGGMKMIVHATTSQGDRVAVEAESHATLNGGAVYNNLYHFLIEVRDGKVVRVKEYHDTAHAFSALKPILDEMSA
jgi:ketosteroid isomerase-like protein